MDKDVEIIEFFKPLGDENNLFVTNIVFLDLDDSMDDSSVKSVLYNKFSQFGLLYEVQVLHAAKEFNKQDIGLANTTTASTSDVPITKGDKKTFYAFVKFYSVISAKKAKSALHLTHFIGKEACKVTFAKRKKENPPGKQRLYVSQCQDLANYYLGFNGWSSEIRLLQREGANVSTVGEQQTISLMCVLDLIIHQRDLKTYGVGISKEEMTDKDLSQFGAVFARCRKRAHQYALENAFSKVLLVILKDGRIYPEINTVVEDPLEELETLDDTELICVKQLEEEPQLSSSDEGNEDDPSDLWPREMDRVNISILDKLEQEAGP